jgi:hypothetical protein
VPEDKKAKAELNKTLIDMGVATINEVRVDEGFEPDPDGDVLLVQSGLVPLSHAVKPPEPPPVPGGKPGEGDGPDEAGSDDELAGWNDDEADQKQIDALLLEIKGLFPS